jgi:hypothetical protein
LGKEGNESISTTLNSSFHFNRICNTIRTPDNHIEFGSPTPRMMLDMPAGFLEDVGEQRFGAVSSFNGRGFLAFF